MLAIKQQLDSGFMPAPGSRVQCGRFVHILGLDAGAVVK
jgi:hypothetical protein